MSLSGGNIIIAYKLLKQNKKNSSNLPALHQKLEESLGNVPKNRKKKL
jgi:hypothetical protein